MSPSSRTSGPMVEPVRRLLERRASPAARCAASSSRRPGLTCTHRRTGPAPDPTRRSGASPGGGRVRWQRHPVYGLVEWAHTSEADGFFEFSSASWPKVHGPRGRHRLHYRFERTERAEEERVSRFRIAPAAPGELDPRHHPLDDPHRRAGPPSCSTGAGWRSRRWSRSPMGGSPRSGEDSSTWSRPTAGIISGAGPWASASSTAAAHIGWDDTVPRSRVRRRTSIEVM